MVICDEGGRVEGLEGGEHGLHVGGHGGRGVGAGGGGAQLRHRHVLAHRPRAARALGLGRVHRALAARRVAPRLGAYKYFRI